MSFFVVFFFSCWMCGLSFRSSGRSLARSDNNQHDDSQTYCDALFIRLRLICPPNRLTTITLKMFLDYDNED